MESTTYAFQGKGKLRKYTTRLFAVVLLMTTGVFNSPGAILEVFPQPIEKWTGSVNAAGTFTQTSVLHAYGGGGERAFMKFDLSAIPDNSTINSVTLYYYVTSMYQPFIRFKRITSDPVTTAGSLIYNQIGTGTQYLQATTYASGWNARSLAGTITTDVKNALVSDWFAIGMHEYEAASNMFLHADGWNQNNKPYLSINYTTTYTNDIAIDSISSPKNQSCEGLQLFKVKIRNGGINAITSATISWSINGVYQADFIWNGNLPVNGTTTITLGDINFLPGNVSLYCLVYSPNGQTDPFMFNNSKTAVVQIIPKPYIIIQPANQSISIGGNATFSLVTSGGNVTYQWQVSIDNGLSFVPLQNTPPYSNVTANNLLITGATQSMNGYLYRCVASGTCPPAAVSETVRLSVGPPITATVGVGYACVGNTVEIPISTKDLYNVKFFTLTLNYDPGSIAYQSFTSVNPLLSGGQFTVTANAGQLVIEYTGAAPVNIPDGIICKLVFLYSGVSSLEFDNTVSGNCKFTDSNGLVFPAVYTNGSINSGIPSIIQQPAATLLAVVGYQTYFFITTLGLPSLQWQVSTNGGSTWANLSNNVTYSQVNGDTLFINPTLSMNTYKYRCVLEGCGAVINSNAGLLTVIKLVKTWVDTIYDCKCQTPPRDVVVPIKVANFDSISSISLHLLYKNTAMQYNGIQNINPGLSSMTLFYNNLVQPLYNDFGFSAYILTGTVALPDNATLFELKFKFLCDTTIFQWNTWGGGQCVYSCDLTTFDAQFINGYVLDGGPLVLSNPAPAVSVFAGDTATFTCTAITYNFPLTYQWEVNTGSGWTPVVNGSTYVGATASTLKVFVNSTAMNGYQYRCKTTGLCNPAWSSSSTLTVNAPPIYVAIPPIISCIGDPIIAPLTVINFSGVCSVSLKLNFNSSLMSFEGYQNLNPALSNPTNFSASSLGNVVTLSWFSLTPASIAGLGTLVELLFSPTGVFTGSPLTFNQEPAGNCQITSCSPPGATINTLYTGTTISVNPIPLAYNVFTELPASGHFCAGSPGVQVGVDATQVGVNYALYRNGVLLNDYSGVSGNGFGIVFNIFNIPGQYTVRASYANTGCSRWMDGYVNIVEDQPPALFTVTGTGSYCAGGTGVAVGLSGSQTDVDYILYLNGYPEATLQGTGSALNFGNQTVPGEYTIVAIHAYVETCPTPMTGSAVITINPYPGAAGAITPNSAVCQGTSVAFCVPAISNATSYTWTLPPGATGSLTTASPCNTISFSTSATSGPLTVKGHNNCGDGNLSSLSLLVNPLPAAAGTISGPNTVCQGAENVTYQVPEISDASTYTWSFPFGFTVVSNNGASVVVNVGAAAVSGNITVYGNNTCGTGPVSNNYGVTVTPKPAAALSISGNTLPCQGQTYPYQTPSISGAGTYTWTYTGTGVTGTTATTNAINLTFSTTATSGNLIVKGHNDCGDGIPFSLPINVQLIPTAAGTITGPTVLCKGSTYTWTVGSIGYANNYSWTKPTGFTGASTSTSITLTVGASAALGIGTISVAGNNSCGNGTPSNLQVTVYDNPTVTHVPNFPVQCLDGNPYVLSGGSPPGGTYSGTGVSAGLFYPATAGTGNHIITYTYTDPNACSASVNKTITVSNFPSISGTVNYDNTVSTPLANVAILLKDATNTTTLDNTLTTASPPVGNYAFRCLSSGTQYNLWCSRSWPWGGVNATDALEIAKYSVGMTSSINSDFRKKVGNVNNDFAINSVDALLVMRRNVGLINTFNIPDPDWMFNQFIFNPITVPDNNPLTQNILALCTGDVNASYSPANLKIKPTVFLEPRGQQAVRELDITEIPFSVKSSLSVNAVTLVINYSSDALEILNVRSSLNGFIYNVMEDQVRLAWYDLQPVNINKDEPLFTLTARIRNNSARSGQAEFEVDPVSEMVDLQSTVYQDVVLTMPELRIESTGDAPPTVETGVFSLGANQPNPFSHFTDISYTLPEEGEVKLSVLNLLGEEVKILMNSFQTSGNYRITFDGSHLVPGMYMYSINVKGKTQHYHKTHTMIIAQ